MIEQSYLNEIEADVLAEWRERSQLTLYQTDPEAWLYDRLKVRLWSKQREIAESFVTNTKTLVKSCNGVGKDLALDTPIPTLSGWTTMSEIQPGDVIYGENGRPTRVVTKSEVFHNPSFRVHFSDGESLVASGTHEWNTLTLRVRAKLIGRVANKGRRMDWRDFWNESETVTTQQIADTLRRKDGVANHLIPIAEPLEREPREQVIHPYLLGLWLGDGSSDTVYLATGGEMQDEATLDAGKRGTFSRELTAIGVETHPVPSAPYVLSFSHQGYQPLLRAIGVLGNKHIPEDYLCGSIEQRTELLRGLMDSDGFNLGAGAGCGLDFSNERLARDARALIQSLGMRCSLGEGEAWAYHADGTRTRGNNRWRMVFNPTSNPFTLDSPKGRGWAENNANDAQFSRRTGRTIVAVEPVDSVPTACISVDNPRHLFLAGEALIPTHNTKLGGFLVTWFISVFPPEETRVLLSAPIREQINTNMFNYLRENYQAAITLGAPLIGEITKAPLWVVTEPFDKHIVIPKRPADENLVSSFQGVHDMHVAVVLDEAGGLPEELLGPAANAVTTNEHARILGIGNPDRLGTGFHERFSDRVKHADWNLISIGADDSPNFTGEIISPDPDEDRKIKSMLVQVSWAEMMRRSSPKGIIKAKVDGEFPDSDDSTFFDQLVINKAFETEIDPAEDARRTLGVDLAFSGTDQSVVYLNHGGRLRNVDAWNKEAAAEHIDAARRVHNLAIEHGADEVRVDKSGIGAGVHSILRSMPEFAGRQYILFGINGANASPNREQWLNSRAYHYDNFRTQIVEGGIDLDIADTEIRDEMSRQPYDLTDRNQIKMMSKREMRSMGIDSPDHLDAAIYSTIPYESLIEGPAAGLAAGEQLALDPWDVADMEMFGMPV